MLILNGTMKISYDIYFLKKKESKKKMKKLLLLALVVFTAFTLVGCNNEKPLLIWVGTESVDFYTDKMNEYVSNYNATHDEEFPYEISVLGVDTGSAASTFMDDTDAGADIFTIAHDNLGKLISGSSSIAPITNTALLAQIASDNPETFLQAVKGTVGGTEYTFGVPYIAQALVLFYNTAFISETQVQTWEGILEASTTAQKQAVSLLGSDGYNNSFLLLARNKTTLTSSLRLYEGGDITDCYATGDDIISIMKWGQRFFGNQYGAKMPTDSGWEVELKNGISLSVIGGAWKYKAAQAALGTNLGVAILPSFTITAADAYGTTTAGTEFWSGSFYDTKMFVMKKGSEKGAYLEDIMMFLSSKEVQEASYVIADNLPAYKNASTEFESMQADTLDAKLARTQLAMSAHGFPQPFGKQSKFNLYYYSKSAPDLINAILVNKDSEFSSFEAIIAQMQDVEQIWKTGAKEVA